MGWSCSAGWRSCPVICRLVAGREMTSEHCRLSPSPRVEQRTELRGVVWASVPTSPAENVCTHTPRPGDRPCGCTHSYGGKGGVRPSCPPWSVGSPVNGVLSFS